VCRTSGGITGGTIAGITGCTTPDITGGPTRGTTRSIIGSTIARATHGIIGSTAGDTTRGTTGGTATPRRLHGTRPRPSSPDDCARFADPADISACETSHAVRPQLPA